MDALEPALRPAQLDLDPGPEYADCPRRWQGIPGIERAPGGRWWAAWYSGGEGEGPGNYIVLATSGDAGHAWSAPRLVARHTDPACRCFDPCLWCDPLGRLWLFGPRARTGSTGGPACGPAGAPTLTANAPAGRRPAACAMA